MNQQLALMRGINVGGKHCLPMKELVSFFESAGCKNVRTYIQSGNVVFEHAERWGTDQAKLIAAEIAQRKGFTPHILILSKREFLESQSGNPFPTDEGKHLHCFFLDAQPKQPKLDRLHGLKSDTEQFALIKKAFYLFAPEGIGRSRMASAVESALGVHATARNWNTMTKLATMLGPS